MKDLKDYEVEEMTSTELTNVDGGKWWCIALGIVTCGAYFAVDFVHDVIINGEQYDPPNGNIINYY